MTKYQFIETNMNKEIDEFLVVLEDFNESLRGLRNALDKLNGVVRENEAMKKDEMESDTHDCHLSPEDGCSHPSHPQI